MQALSREHVDVIIRLVNNAGISYSHLKDDLIDHLCCDIENEMEAGSDFQSAYEKVRENTGLRGLKKIQEDTIKLINKKYRIMKNTMKIFGIITLILLALGATFKIFHWPGAGIMLVLGFALLTFVFFPATLWVFQKESKFQGKTLFSVITFVSFTLFMLGVLFKVQHWPGTGILLFSGIASVTLLFFPLMIYNNLKQIPDKRQKRIHLLGYISLIFYILGFMFKVFHWPGAAVLLIVGAISLTTVFLPVFTFYKYKSMNYVSHQFIFLIIALVYFNMFTLLLSVKSSKKIMHEFIYAGKLIENQHQFINQMNSKYYTLTENKELVDKELLKQSKTNVQEVIGTIENLKIGLVRFAEKVDEERAIYLLEHPEIMQHKDNIKVVQFVMLGENDNGKASVLKNQLLEFNLFVRSHFNSSEGVMQLLELINTDDVKDQEGNIRTWEAYHFARQNVINCIHNLSLMQRNMKLIEGELIRTIAMESEIEKMN